MCACVSVFVTWVIFLWQFWALSDVENLQGSSLSWGESALDVAEIKSAHESEGSVMEQEHGVYSSNPMVFLF